MSELKYGYAYGGHTGVEIPVAASEYFNRQGGHFVIASSNTGYAELADVTATHLFGYAEVPKDATGYNAWVSSSTAGHDKVFVITDPTAVYAMTIETGASIVQALVGDNLDLVESGATYTLKQYVDGTTGTTNVLTVLKVDVENDILYVKINQSSPGGR